LQYDPEDALSLDAYVTDPQLWETKQQNQRTNKRADEAAARDADKWAVQRPGEVAKADEAQLGIAAQTVGPINNQASYDVWRAGLPANIQARVPVMFSPSAVQIVQRMGMSATDQATDADRDATREMTGQHYRNTEALTRRGQEITVRGQNMTDRRAREMATIARDQKPPTGGERLTLGFYMRAAEANRSIEALESHIRDMGLAGQARYAYAPNVMQSDENQKLQQAQRAFTEARLRRDSGAAIPETEFENDRKMYFPQPGDGTAVLEQKRLARQQVLRALRIGAGRAMRDIGEEPGDLPQAPQTPAAPAAAVTVRAPNGKTYTFPTQAAADAFKREAGIR
jgi:hypothetical protein